MEKFVGNCTQNILLWIKETFREIKTESLGIMFLRNSEANFGEEMLCVFLWSVIGTICFWTLSELLIITAHNSDIGSLLSVICLGAGFVFSFIGKASFLIFCVFWLVVCARLLYNHKTKILPSRLEKIEADIDWKDMWGKNRHMRID